jgi:hypothetical protein
MCSRTTRRLKWTSSASTRARMTSFWSTLHSPLSLLYALFSALCSLLSALYCLFSALCSVLCALYSLFSALCSVLSALCSVLSALCALCSTLSFSMTTGRHPACPLTAYSRRKTAHTNTHTHTHTHTHTYTHAHTHTSTHTHTYTHTHTHQPYTHVGERPDQARACVPGSHQGMCAYVCVHTHRHTHTHTHTHTKVQHVVEKGAIYCTSNTRLLRNGTVDKALLSNMLPPKSTENLLVMVLAHARTNFACEKEFIVFF